MLTDEWLSTIERGDVYADRSIPDLIAQAREANALRAENEWLRASADAKDLALQWADGDIARLRAQLAEACQLIEAQAPVVEAAERFTDSRGKNDRIYLVVVDYRAFLAAHQPTNVPALISSMVVARVTTTDGETKMVPATLDGEVKT
jgi:hypothetical protein